MFIFNTYIIPSLLCLWRDSAAMCERLGLAEAERMKIFCSCVVVWDCRTFEHEHAHSECLSSLSRTFRFASDLTLSALSPSLLDVYSRPRSPAPSTHSEAETQPSIRSNSSLSKYHNAAQLRLFMSYRALCTLNASLHHIRTSLASISRISHLLHLPVSDSVSVHTFFVLCFSI